MKRLLYLLLFLMAFTMNSCKELFQIQVSYTWSTPPSMVSDNNPSTPSYPFQSGSVHLTKPGTYSLTYRVNSITWNGTYTVEHGINQTYIIAIELAQGAPIISYL